MEGEKGEFHGKRMEMWKMRQEMIDAMGEKELRAFIKGYMMGQGMVFRQLRKMEQCRGDGCGGCGSCSGGGSQCGAEACGCGKENCDCEKK